MSWASIWEYKKGYYVISEHILQDSTAGYDTIYCFWQKKTLSNCNQLADSDLYYYTSC